MPGPTKVYNSEVEDCKGPTKPHDRKVMGMSKKVVKCTDIKKLAKGNVTQKAFRKPRERLSYVFKSMDTPQGTRVNTHMLREASRNCLILPRLKLF